VPPKKKIPKEKPSMTTVKEGFRVSDLLRVEVCDPIKAQLDKIRVCTPNLKEPVTCLPDTICRPSFDCSPYTCRPIWWCRPDMWCRPEILDDPYCFPVRPCGPSFFPRGVLSELKTIKAEIAELKKAIK
jgi:hypothetical protein